MKLAATLLVATLAVTSAAQADQATYTPASFETVNNSGSKSKSGYSGFNRSDSGEIRISPGNDSR